MKPEQTHPLLTEDEYKKVVALLGRDVAKTNLVAILEQNGIANVRSL